MNTFDGATVRQYWYDDARSLGLKASWARDAALGGVGPYTFGYVAALDASARAAVWGSFDAFVGGV